MNPSTPKNYDIGGHNESARWKNTMQNLGMPWTSEEIAFAHHWWSEERPADKDRRLILDNFQSPNGYSPLLGIVGGNEYMSAHAELAKKRTNKLVLQMLNDAGVLSKKYTDLKNTLAKRGCALPDLLNMLGDRRLPFGDMLNIVLKEVFRYIDSLEDEEHRNLCKEYIILFFRIHGDGSTAFFVQISGILKEKGIVIKNRGLD